MMIIAKNVIVSAKKDFFISFYHTKKSKDRDLITNPYPMFFGFSGGLPGLSPRFARVI